MYKVNILDVLFLWPPKVRLFKWPLDYKSMGKNNSEVWTRTQIGVFLPLSQQMQPRPLKLPLNVVWPHKGSSIVFSNYSLLGQCRGSKTSASCLLCQYESIDTQDCLLRSAHDLEMKSNFKIIFEINSLYIIWHFIVREILQQVNSSQCFQPARFPNFQSFASLDLSWSAASSVHWAGNRITADVSASIRCEQNTGARRPAGRPWRGSLNRLSDWPCVTQNATSILHCGRDAALSDRSKIYTVDGPCWFSLVSFRPLCDSKLAFGVHKCCWSLLQWKKDMFSL